jgi:1-pyrroline-5-carboxylate dehydrogenase
VLRGREEFGSGNYVAPAVVVGLPVGGWLLRGEFFVVLAAVLAVGWLAEGMTMASSVALGLSAGFLCAGQAGTGRFLSDIQAGVVYISRSAGATVGAWPGMQPSGGWKGPGSPGKAGTGVRGVGRWGARKW